ncbi:MarR family transcriptional regulator [Natrialbaceae archaeon A-CW2]|uniref:MarR family transcriptional regulator n=1 Tax=Natronosalvus amylolyticus TaxID=2961994 RepID=UPI0020C96B7A|nr:helix-turn-helix domain-containing protein [Natronosalvus amylolyticus]
MPAAASDSDQTLVWPPTDSNVRERLREQPPSAKLVAIILGQNTEMTQTELVEETLLPRRTVHHALDKLEEHSLVQSRSSVVDARKRIYSLRSECGP